MKLYSENDSYKLYNGNMLDMLEVIEPSSIDSIVCDPPYELNFMGKGWDNSGIAFQPDTWEKCYEVLKPGGYLLAFGGSRTFHRIACAIEDAGFEIRDTIMWLYGSGFPKSMDISKQIDKHLGVEREVIGKYNPHRDGSVRKRIDNSKFSNLQGVEKKYIECGLKDITAPATDLAKQWQGWGTALKPSFEPIIVARKPFKGSLVDNVIENGVGGINIDECRVGNEELHNSYAGNKNSGFTNADERDTKGKGMFSGIKKGETIVNGRFPANTILTYDETDFDEVCGGFPDTKSKGSKANYEISNSDNIYNFANGKNIKSGVHFEDSGSASRYFYCAKASKKDRDEGLEEIDEKPYAVSNQAIAELKRGNLENTENRSQMNSVQMRKNTHPTVKPTDLMQYLVRLVTPNGGTILDPFNGSGSTGKAVMYENKERNKNYKYIGIELTEEYLPIAQARIEYVCNQINNDKQTTIFDFLGDLNE